MIDALGTKKSKQIEIKNNKSRRVKKLTRLSKRDERGMAYTLIPLNNSTVIGEEGEIISCHTGFIADRLAEYEDIGLGPERIRKLIREYIRLAEGELDMASEPIDIYSDEDLVEYVEELQSHLEHYYEEE